MKTPELIIFDFDGTLADTTDSILSTYRLTIEELDMETLKTFSKLFTDDIYKAINPTASVNSKKALGGPSVGNTVQVIKINEEWVKDKKNQLEKM